MPSAVCTRRCSSALPGNEPGVPLVLLFILLEWVERVSELGDASPLVAKASTKREA
jgi:hypothetical protein